MTLVRVSSPREQAKVRLRKVSARDKIAGKIRAVWVDSKRSVYFTHSLMSPKLETTRSLAT